MRAAVTAAAALAAAVTSASILRWLSYGAGGYSRRQLVPFLMPFPSDQLASPGRR